MHEPRRLFIILAAPHMQSLPYKTFCRAKCTHSLFGFVIEWQHASHGACSGCNANRRHNDETVMWRMRREGGRSSLFTLITLFLLSFNLSAMNRNRSTYGLRMKRGGLWCCHRMHCSEKNKTKHTEGKRWKKGNDGREMESGRHITSQDVTLPFGRLLCQIQSGKRECLNGKWFERQKAGQDEGLEGESRVET